MDNFGNASQVGMIASPNLSKKTLQQSFRFMTFLIWYKQVES
jgi:hypothetical protein